MDWSNEDYVRVYTRETEDDVLLSWDAMCVWRAMLTKFDRSGVIVGRTGARGLAAVLRAPVAVVESAIPELLADGRLQQIPNGYFAPNFMAAQEATKSDRQRQKDSRERRRANASSESIPSGEVTPRDGAVPKRDVTSQNVTESHERSHGVTNGHSYLCSADPDPDPLRASPRARAIPGTAAPAPTHEASSLEQRRQLTARIWTKLIAARAELITGLNLTARQLHPQDPGERDLADRVREYGDDLERAESDANHVLAVRVAEARANKSVQWLSGAMFGEKTWRAALGMEATKQPDRIVVSMNGPRARIKCPPSLEDPEQDRADAELRARYDREREERDAAKRAKGML